MEGGCLSDRGRRIIVGSLLIWDMHLKCCSVIVDRRSRGAARSTAPFAQPSKACSLLLRLHGLLRLLPTIGGCISITPRLHSLLFGFPSTSEVLWLCPFNCWSSWHMWVLHLLHNLSCFSLQWLRRLGLTLAPHVEYHH